MPKVGVKATPANAGLWNTPQVYEYSETYAYLHANFLEVD